MNVQNSFPDPTRGHNPTFYWGATEPTEEEIAFAAAHNERMVAQTHEAVEAMGDNFENLSNDERFRRIRKFIDIRARQSPEHANGGDRKLGSRIAFDALTTLRTDSIFLNRLIEYGKLREAHTLLTYSDYFVPDEAASDPAAWEEYAAYKYADPAPEGVKFELSDAGRQHIQEVPEDTALIEFGLHAMNTYPWFGDEDYYPPSPYSALLTEGVDNGGVSAEQELAIETVHLFGLNDIHDVSESARKQLFHVGVNLNEQDYDRINKVSGWMSADRRQTFAEAFLATEFGDDLGESILQIAEKSKNDEKALDVLRLISSIRQQAHAWESAAWFGQKDSEYRGYFSGIKQGLEMRISQILSPVPDLMDDIPQRAEYFHRDGSLAKVAEIKSVDEVIAGLKVLELAIRKIAQAESTPQAQRKVVVEDDYVLAKTTAGQATVNVMMRARETDQSEARMRWAVDITPEEQLEIFGKYLELNTLGQARNARVTIRLDLEKISKRAALDLGSSMEFDSSQREYPGRLLAYLVTAGVQHQMRAAAKEVKHEDYHVRDTFGEELSDPNTFAAFIEAGQRHYVGEKASVDLGKFATELMKTPAQPENAKDVAYTGLFFDESTLSRLREMWPAGLPNIPKDPHVTIKFRPKDGLGSVLPGERVAIKVLGMVNDGKTKALIIDRAGPTIDVKTPHITVSTGNDEQGAPIAPSYSKKSIIDAQQNGGVTWFDTPVELMATSGYFDGRTGQIVTKS